MNTIIATVKDIVSLERLNLIKFELNFQEINVLILEMNIDISIGKKAELIIKPTAISVINEKCDFENVLKAKVKSVKRGTILTSLFLDVEGYEIEALTLKKDFNKEVYIAFKANDIAIVKVFND